MNYDLEIGSIVTVAGMEQIMSQAGSEATFFMIEERTGKTVVVTYKEVLEQKVLNQAGFAITPTVEPGWFYWFLGGDSHANPRLIVFEGIYSWASED